ncbi:hypothetical protein ANTQUA_LOCUS7249 [Anthophora quadrimaculata]
MLVFESYIRRVIEPFNTVPADFSSSWKRIYESQGRAEGDGKKRRRSKEEGRGRGCSEKSSCRFDEWDNPAWQIPYQRNKWER